VQQFRLLLNRKLCIAGQKEFGGKTAGRRIFSLRFHLLGNAQALKEFGEIDAAGAARRWLAMGDGFRFEQRLRKSLWRGYVGLRRARFHRNGDARPGQRHIRTR
jgi:hypothetical protein